MKEKTMEINFKSKKIIALIITAVIILAVVSALGYHYYQQQKLERKIDEAFSRIEKTEEDFNGKDTREDKIAVLQHISEEYAEYEKSDDVIEEVEEKYLSVISDMQKVLKEEYDKILAGNTLKDIDKIGDKEQLSNAAAELGDLLQTIQDETGIVCTEDEAAEYETKIAAYIKDYDERIAAIDAEQKTAGQGSGNLGGNSSGAAGEAGNKGSSSSDGRYQTGWSYYESEEGRTDYKHYSDGSWSATDDEGNSWTSDDLKEWLD